MMNIFKERNPMFNKDEILSKYSKRLDFESVAFESKEDFKKRFDIGIPIYADETYYVQEKNVTLVTKDNWEYWAKWRDCHYYKLMESQDGSKAYIMTGGRYD